MNCLEYFGLWTKTLSHLQSSFPVFRMDSNNCFLSILADPPFLFEIHFLPLPYCFSLYSFSYCVCVWDINGGLSGSRLCLNQFCSIGAVPFLYWSAWEDVQRRGRLHFNKEPSLSSLMLCCHALQLQRSQTLVTENWSKRHWAFPELSTTHHNIPVPHTVYSRVMAADCAVSQARVTLKLSVY